MSKATLGRDVARELVKAMALPTEGCTAVEVGTPLGGAATLTVTYLLTTDALAIAAKALKDQEL